MVDYEKLKELPDEEKIEVLKELAEKYTRDGKPYFPQMATVLGGSVISVANMYRKLVEGKPVGRPKNSKNKKPANQELQKNEFTNEKETATNNNDNEKMTKFDESSLVEEQRVFPTKNKNFALAIDGTFDGEEANERIVAVANSFYKNAKYSVELKVKEL